MNIHNTDVNPPALNDLVTLAALQQELAHIFPSSGSLDWEVRRHRLEYIEAGALFEIAGRLMAHPGIFKRAAIEIGARKVATRAGVKSASSHR